jgi:hypothetical protein
MALLINIKLDLLNVLDNKKVLTILTYIHQYQE